jgi:hypothetical protein
MSRLKLPTALGMSRILKSCLAREVDVVSVESCPRMFGFSTGLYTDHAGKLIGALVLDTKLCCAIAACVAGLSEEEGQDLVLMQNLPAELHPHLEELFELLACAFFLEDGSDRLRCTLYKVCLEAADLPPSVKPFMASPALHQTYQAELGAYGEGTLLFIGGDQLTLEEEANEQ